MWCESEKQCVAKNSYPVSFPYGQCRGWIEELQCSGEYIGVMVALCYSMALFQFFLQFASKFCCDKSLCVAGHHIGKCFLQIVSISFVTRGYTNVLNSETKGTGDKSLERCRFEHCLKKSLQRFTDCRSAHRIGLEPSFC